MSYLGAVTSAVGGELQGWASVLEKRKMAQEFAAEQARQMGYRAEGTGTFERALPTMGREQAEVDLGIGRGQRMADYVRNEAVPLGFTTPNSATSGADKGYSNIVGQRRAALGAYSDWGLQQMIRNIRTQQALDKITNFAGGTASVFPYRMYKAQHSLDQLAMIGSAISSLGGAASNFSQYTQAPGGGGGGGGAAPPSYSLNFGASGSPVYGDYYGMQTQSPFNPYAFYGMGGYLP